MLSCILWFLDIYGFQIFKEKVFDLLDSNHADVRLDYSVSVVPKQSALARGPIQIRETATGGITLAGL